MSKSAKELYAVPDWMRPYLPLFHNTGGNDVEELLHDDNTSMFTNSIRYMLIVSVRSQFTLLMGLHQRGFLSTVSDAFLAEVRASGIDAWIESLGDKWNGTTKDAERFAENLRKGVRS